MILWVYITKFRTTSVLLNKLTSESLPLFGSTCIWKKKKKTFFYIFFIYNFFLQSVYLSWIQKKQWILISFTCIHATIHKILSFIYFLFTTFFYNLFTSLEYKRNNEFWFLLHVYMQQFMFHSKKIHHHTGMAWKRTGG